MNQTTRSKNNKGVNQTILEPLSVFRHVKYEHLIAGVSGGVTSTLVLHPLDLLKIRFAVHDGQVSTRPQYKSLGNAVHTIFRDEGIRGLYKGVTPNCWGAGTAWGFYFFFYNALKAWMVEGQTNSALGPGKHMLAAAEAGVLTLVMTNPIWVVKTRMCLQYQRYPVEVAASSSSSTVQYYNGMVDTLVKVYRHEGVSGLYKGFLPGVFGVSHGALQFMVYEEMKKHYTSYYQMPTTTKLGTLEYLSFAALSKLVAASTTYPYQVLRARLQDQHRHYTGVWDVTKQTWRFEGLRGFYKGLSAYLVHVMPNICIVFIIYEQLAPPSEPIAQIKQEEPKSII